MIFDGLKFRISKTIVPLPAKYWEGPQQNYITFGTIVREYSGLMPEGAVETDYKFSSGNKVFAVPIHCEGHGLTNKMHGKVDKNGKFTIYLAIDGKVYTCKRTRGKHDPVYP